MAFLELELKGKTSLLALSLCCQFISLAPLFIAIFLFFPNSTFFQLDPAMACTSGGGLLSLLLRMHENYY